MARVDHTPLTLLGPYPDLQPAALSATVTWVAADATNKNQCPLTGKEILLVRNTDAGAHTVTVTSAPNARNRTGHITAYALAAGKTAAFGPFDTNGWVQSGAKLYFEADDATVEFAVLRLP